MGWLSTKKKKRFFTAVQRMVDDADIVLSSKTAVMNYLFEDKGSGVSIMGKSLPDYLIESANAAMPASFKRAYYYANKGHYAYGLPKAEGVSQTAIDVPAKVTEYLETTLGTSINLFYANLEEANYYHFMWQILIENYGYNPTTNELANLSSSVGFTCYLTSAQINYTDNTMNAVLDNSYLSQWGLSAEFGETTNRVQDFTRATVPYVINSTALEDFAHITYEYEEVIPDTTAPAVPKIQNFDGTVLNGVAEVESEVSIYDGSTLLGSGICDSTGTFSITLTSEILTEVSILTGDSAANASDPVLITAPYADTSDLGVGDQPTQTVFRREATFDFDFLAYIESTNPEDESAVYTPYPDYVMASYSYDNGSVTEIRFLTYAYASGTITELDNIVELADAAGEFFPRLYARLDGVDLSTLDSSDPRVKSSKRIARLLGMDWLDWVKTTQENIEELSDVKQLFMTLAAPINTNDAAVLNYLYKYFLKLHTDITEVPPVEDAPLYGNFNDIKQGMFLNITDTVYGHGISFEGIGVADIEGVLGDVGFISCTYHVGELIGTEQVGYFSQEIWEKPYHSIKFQFNTTHYREVRIFRLVSRHNFSGGGTSVSGTDEALVIPLDRALLGDLLQQDLEILFAKSLHMFVNVVKIIKTKWYARGAFKVVMAIVAIVISVVTVGAGAPFAAYAYAAIYALAIGFAISIAIQYLAKILVKLGVNAKIVGIIVVIAVIIAAFLGASDYGKALNITATTLMQATNAAFQLVSQMNTLEMKSLVKEMDAFNAMTESKQELLDKAQMMLDTGTVPLSLQLLLGSSRSEVFIKLGETPDMFFTRTLELTNPGTLCFELLSNHVDTSLRLPDMRTLLAQTQRT